MSKNKPPLIPEISKEAADIIDREMKKGVPYNPDPNQYADTVRAPINETPAEEPIPLRMDNLLEEISTLNLDINELDEKIAKAHGELEQAQTKKGTLQERHVRVSKELRKLLGEKL